VRKFIAFAKARFPARRYALMLYGHADGRAMCPDEDSGKEMGFAQLTDKVPEELSVDLMALELCNMGGIEVAYQWRPGNGGFSTRYLVAIPNAGPPLDWDRVFARVAEREPGAALPEPESFGRLIVEEGGKGRQAAAESNPRLAGRLGHEAVACYDLAEAAAVKRAVDAVAVQLGAGDTLAAAEEARGPGSAGWALNFGRDRADRAPFFDLHDLALRLAASERLPEATRQAAKALAAAVDAFIVASWGGPALRRFEGGKSGVYIIFPDGDATIARDNKLSPLWSLCRWYSPLPVPGVYGKLAFCRDGATPGNGKVENWFELLDAWFDASAHGPGSNGYEH
jgi:clostripain